MWCTGFGRDYSPGSSSRWPGRMGSLRHSGGVADGEPGLYFVGLPSQTRLASGLIGGVGEDASSVAEVIAIRLRQAAGLKRTGAPAVELALGHH